MAKLGLPTRPRPELSVHEGAIMIRGRCTGALRESILCRDPRRGVPGEPPAKEPRAAVRRALMDYADLCYRERLAVLAPMVGREPRGMQVRAQTSRWGSCSSRGDLSLNYKIVMAPPQVMDYILIHELCHLYEMNHSQRFWARLKRHMPYYEEWKKWLQTNVGMLGV